LTAFIPYISYKLEGAKSQYIGATLHSTPEDARRELDEQIFMLKQIHACHLDILDSSVEQKEPDKVIILEGVVTQKQDGYYVGENPVADFFKHLEHIQVKVSINAYNITITDLKRSH
jgi:hypothetical protein